MSLKGYKKFNESRSHKPRRGHKGGNMNTPQHQRFPNSSWKEYPPRFTNKIEPRGMNMTFSERFKYILTEISKKGNKIAKELLELPNKPEAKFEYSYLDIAGRQDTISYLPNGARDILEEERYRSNKRQHSKIYKTIKTIFGSKYTKNEVTKFVSIYNEVYKQGPDKTDTTKSKQSDEQLLKKIIEDTKSDKLKWEKETGTGNMVRYESKVAITKKKYLAFCFFHFDRSIKDEAMSFITINLYNDSSKTKDDKTVWINTLQFKDIRDFLPVFKEKFKIEWI